MTGEPVLKSAVMPLSPCARSCALSPDGSFAAAGFDDGSLRVRGETLTNDASHLVKLIGCYFHIWWYNCGIVIK